MKKSNKKFTISDVANYAGVSKSTVSNYLNGKYDRMKGETKERIEQAIDMMDYVPSLSARRLSAKEKSKTVCLIIPGNLSHLFDTMYFPTVFNVVGHEAEKRGYSVLIYVRNDLGKGCIDYLLGLSSSLVDGFIVFDLAPQDRYFKEFERNDIPYICVGKIAGYEDYRYVATDHGQGIRLAIEHLISLGHKKIAMVTDDNRSVVGQVRKQSFIETIEKNGLEYREDYFLSLPKKPETDDEAKDVFVRLLQSPDCPTGILVASTLLHHMKRVMRDYDLYTPDDFSVIAVDYYGEYDSTYAGFVNKEYTRVESVVRKVAKRAFIDLVNLIESPDKKFESYLEPVTLTVGMTTGRCPESE